MSKKKQQLTAGFTLLPSVKKAWLKALRSGEYPQGRGALFIPPELAVPGWPSGYCCLGVLCKVLGYSDDTLRGKALPEEVDEQISAEVDGELSFWWVKPRGERVTLSELNDTERFSFKQIANIIDRCVPTHRS